MLKEETSDILFNRIPAQHGEIGLIQLNRPKALNALSVDMILALDHHLAQWATDPQIVAVIITSTFQKAFCAGGDLKFVFYNGKAQYEQADPFFRKEYRLIKLIHAFPKPYIVLLDGITMGGGCGISLHGTRVIAGENLRLAMPETGIGFYPDVGAGHFFARGPRKIGMYLGLTGSIINVDDAQYAKLVHNHIPSNKFSDFIHSLQAKDLRNDALKTIDAIIAEYSQPPQVGPVQKNIDIVEKCFSADSIEQILANLEHESSQWAKQQLALLNTRSPTSLKVTFKYLTLASQMSVDECLTLDFNLTLHLMQKPDIYEGIRAVLIDKTNDPKWDPAKLQDVTDESVNQALEIKCQL
jgi:enoyl-CoA hydratase/carnithine racemase